LAGDGCIYLFKIVGKKRKVHGATTVTLCSVRCRFRQTIHTSFESQWLAPSPEPAASKSRSLGRVVVTVWFVHLTKSRYVSRGRRTSVVEILWIPLLKNYKPKIRSIYFGRGRPRRHQIKHVIYHRYIII